MTDKFAPAKRIVKKLEEEFASSTENPKYMQYKCEIKVDEDWFYQAECEPLQIRRADGYRNFMVKEKVYPEENLTKIRFGVMYDAANEDIMMNMVCDNNKGSRNKCVTRFERPDMVGNPISMTKIIENNEVPNLTKKRYDWLGGYSNSRVRIYVSQRRSEKIPTISFVRNDKPIT